MIEGSSNMSVQRQESLVWHLVLNSQQLEKHAHLFYKRVKKISPTVSTINAHLNTEEIDKIRIFREVVGGFFVGYLPFPVILRVFLIFLNEGFQVFYRIYYAILKMTDRAIRDCASTKQILRIIKTQLLNDLAKPDQVKRLFRLAFDLRLSPNNLKKLELASMKSRKSETIYFLP